MLLDRANGIPLAPIRAPETFSRCMEVINEILEHIIIIITILRTTCAAVCIKRI